MTVQSPSVASTPVSPSAPPVPAVQPDVQHEVRADVRVAFPQDVPVLSLSSGEEVVSDLHLDAIAPGEHHKDTVIVRYWAHEDSVVALSVECADPATASRDVHVGVFEHSRELMPFPVFSGSLLDLARRDRAFGRWTGRGDGVDHEVVYEISTSVARDAASASEPADVTLRFTATRS